MVKEIGEINNSQQFKRQNEYRQSMIAERKPKKILAEKKNQPTGNTRKPHQRRRINRQGIQENPQRKRIKAHDKEIQLPTQFLERVGHAWLASNQKEETNTTNIKSPQYHNHHHSLEERR